MSTFRCVAVEMRELGCPTSQAQSLVVSLFSNIVPPGADVSLQDVAYIFRRPEVSQSLHCRYFQNKHIVITRTGNAPLWSTYARMS